MNKYSLKQKVLTALDVEGEVREIYFSDEDEIICEVRVSDDMQAWQEKDLKAINK